MNSMTAVHRLPFALLLSLVLHLSLLYGVHRHLSAPPEPAPRRPLEARLRPPAVATPAPQAAPQLQLPDAVRRPAPARERPPAPARPTRRAIVVAPSAGQPAVRAAQAQLARHLLYPAEAVRRGLEGEVQVLLVLDEAGDVLGARVERSSGHALLDEAAVAAVRELRGVPGAATGELLLPVRFKLR